MNSMRSDLLLRQSSEKGSSAALQKSLAEIKDELAKERSKSTGLQSSLK